MLITTTPGIEGSTVTQYLGVVTVQGVLGVNASLGVGPSPVRTSWPPGQRRLAEMEQQAAHPGADAVVGVDIDDETVGDKMLMVSASGMAAKLGGPGPGSPLVMSGATVIPPGPLRPKGSAPAGRPIRGDLPGQHRPARRGRSARVLSSVGLPGWWPSAG
jgi:uncharacterized protein YbjQ (UPF0145 family)